MTQRNERKRVLVTPDEWKSIKNAARFQEIETTFEECYVPPMKTAYEPETTTTITITSKALHDFIDHARSILKNEKVLPIDLKRAIFLSDVFTEKENQLKFTKILQKIRAERKRTEDERIMSEQKERLAMHRENSKKMFQSKLLLGRRLKEEVCQIKKQTKEQRRRQIAQEKEEQIQAQREEEENKEKQKLAELQKKTELRNVFENDLQRKLKEREKMEKEEKENRNFDCQFALTRIHSEKGLQGKMKIMNERSLPSAVSGKMKSKVHDFETWPQPQSKSEIEKKRELYEKKLKEERIIMYKHQIRELLTRKEQESGQKQIELAQRIQNVEVTNSFLNQRKRDYLETVKENRHIWSQQCRERKLKHENERLEDVQRLQKLKNDMRREDEEYLKDVYAAWRKCKNAGKNAFPILKCIREFTKNCNISVPFEE